MRVVFGKTAINPRFSATRARSLTAPLTHDMFSAPPSIVLLAFPNMFSSNRKRSRAADASSKVSSFSTLLRSAYTVMANTEHVYTDEEIQQRLVGPLQHWYLEDGWLRRKYRTEGWKGTLMVVNTVGHLAEAAWHHPDLTVSYAFVTVKLKTHTAKGITDKDFALATKIESVVHWQPGLEDGPLEGTPADDQRFRYIKYDAPKPAQGS